MSVRASKPSSDRAKLRRAAAAEEGEGRIVADVPRSVYLAVKMHCLEQKIEMRALVLDLLAERGIVPRDWRTG